MAFVFEGFDIIFGQIVYFVVCCPIWRTRHTSPVDRWVDGWRVRPAGWKARIGWSGPARPAWLKAAAARFCCRPGRGISWRPPAYSLLTTETFEIHKVDGKSTRTFHYLTGSGRFRKISQRRWRICRPSRTQMLAQPTNQSLSRVFVVSLSVFRRSRSNTHTVYCVPTETNPPGDERRRSRHLATVTSSRKSGALPRKDLTNSENTQQQSAIKRR